MTNERLVLDDDELLEYLADVVDGGAAEAIVGSRRKPLKLKIDELDQVEASQDSSASGRAHGLIEIPD